MTADPLVEPRLLSIVIVTLNCAAKVAGTLGSVTRQTARADVQLIVVDGASIDDTVSVAQGFNPDVLLSERDRGIYDAMNKSIALARGRYCMFVNAGDELASPTIVAELKSTLAQSHSDVVFGGHKVRYPDGLIVAVEPRSSMDGPGMPFSHQAALYRTSRLRQYPFDTSYRLAADYDQLLRMIRDGIAPQSVPHTIAIVEAGGVSDARRLAVIREWSRIGGFRREYLAYVARAVLKRIAHRVLPAKTYDAIDRRVRMARHVP